MNNLIFLKSKSRKNQFNVQVFNPHYSWILLSMNVNAGNPDLGKLNFGLPKF